MNNVETLSHIPHILRHGADWFRSVGTPDTPGTMVFTISGDVATPGVFELPMGTPLDTLVFENGGGMRPGRTLKAVLSGVSNAVIQPSMLKTPMDFGSMQAIGSGLGSGGFVVFDDSTCMVTGGSASDLDLVLEGAAMAPYANRRYLPVEHSVLVPSLVRAFATEFEEHFARGCSGCRDFVVPRFTDFDERSRMFADSGGVPSPVHS